MSHKKIQDLETFRRETFLMGQGFEPALSIYSAKLLSRAWRDGPSRVCFNHSTSPHPSSTPPLPLVEALDGMHQKDLDTKILTSISPVVKL